MMPVLSGAVFVSQLVLVLQLPVVAAVPDKIGCMRQRQAHQSKSWNKVSR